MMFNRKSVARPGGRLRRLIGLGRDETGSATVEFALWAPVLVGMVMTVADISLVLTTNANMQHAARETSRALARHQITIDQSEDYIRSILSLGTWEEYSVAVSDGPEVSVQLTLPANSASIFGLYQAIMPGDLVARSVMRAEDEE